MIENIKGYHVNKKTICETVVEQKHFDLLKCQEDHNYLGRGIYFWDNISNAKYWKKSKENKEIKIQEAFSILSCNLLLDHLLDLTDKDTLGIIEKMWHEVKSRNASHEADDIGSKIDYLFELIDGLKEFRILKMNARYNYRFYKSKIFSRYYSHDTRMIYCVKQEGVICGNISIEKVG